jgi:hypothetical protein
MLRSTRKKEDYAANYTLRSPEVDALDNENEETTQITWPETADENEPTPGASTPPPERRSRRRRKTSYTDILAQSKSIAD